MSVQMVRDLRALATERGPGVYLVTVSEEGGPHTVYTTARWENGDFVAEAGTTTAANAVPGARRRRLQSHRGRPGHGRGRRERGTTARQAHQGRAPSARPVTGPDVVVRRRLCAAAPADDADQTLRGVS